MKRKKYITTSVFLGVVILASGAIYYCYPNAIKNFLGSGVEANNVAEIDVSQSDSVSSTENNEAYAVPSSSSQSLSDVDMLATDSYAENNVASDAYPSSVPSDADFDNVSASSDTPSNIIGTDDSVEAATRTIAQTTSSSVTSLASCSFPANVEFTTRKIILNEIAWMGSPSSSSAEWIEIKNSSPSNIDLSGWELLNASGKIKISFSDGDIPAGGLFLLSRGTASISSGTDSDEQSGKIYSGDLVNAGDVLALIDPQCMVSDYLDASQGWPGGNNTTKQTLERDGDGVGWHTSALPGGTPGMENSAAPPPVQYTLSVAFEGSGPDSISSDPANLSCSASCMGSYASGTQITLTPIPGKNSVFSGWSGLCYGQTDCSFVIKKSTSIIANFSSLSAPTSVPQPPEDPPNSTSTPTSTIIVPTSTTNPVSQGNILIYKVQIAGASSSANDFIELYNPANAEIDVSGWKLHKKSQTGADYSIKEFPTGSIIGPGQTFVWGNSTGGFSETIDANVSSAETLSADNSVAVMDPSGNVIDALAWGTGTGQYGEGSPYPTNPGPGQVLVRQSSGSTMANTDNNATDFILQ